MRIFPEIPIWEPPSATLHPLATDHSPRLPLPLGVTQPGFRVYTDTLRVDCGAWQHSGGKAGALGRETRTWTAVCSAPKQMVILVKSVDLAGSVYSSLNEHWVLKTEKHPWALTLGSDSQLALLQISGQRCWGFRVRAASLFTLSSWPSAGHTHLWHFVFYRAFVKELRGKSVSLLLQRKPCLVPV